MYDRGISVLEQYGLEAKSTYRGRGALICDTQAGLVQIREYNGSPRKLGYQAKLLEIVSTRNQISVDSLLPNQEGAYVSADKDNIPYVVKRWYEGRECDTQSMKDIKRSVTALASLHKTMKMPVQTHYVKEPLLMEYERKNRELRKIRKFVCQKRRKNDFELRYLDSIACYLWHAEEAQRRLNCSDYEDLRCRSLETGDVCHGEYNQHNVLMLAQNTAVINFDRWHYDVQMEDLYQFMRKILEKHNWDLEMGRQMLLAYHEEKPMNVQELENLRIRFAYPEKFWKLANYYYSHSKAWISEKNLEKLEKLIAQHDNWMNFVENISV